MLITQQYALLKAYATKPWVHYHRMQAFMPGTQPWGIHAFDPGSQSESSQSATQALNAINAEDDGAEDQVGPPLDSLMANIPAAPDYILASSFASPGPSSTSGSTRPPLSSSLLPTVHPLHDSIQQCDTSMGLGCSAYSVTTGTGSVSDARSRKRKHNASSVWPPNCKRTSKSKTDDLNPVIIFNAPNSTLNCIADVMERTLDATTTATPPIAPPSIVMSPIEFQTSSTPSQPPGLPSDPSSASLSSTPILNQVVWLISADDSGLSEDELLSASLFFTSGSEDAVCAAHTFIALGNNQAVQHCFLLCQLDMAALLPERGKARALDDDDHFMVY